MWIRKLENTFFEDVDQSSLELRYGSCNIVKIKIVSRRLYLCRYNLCSRVLDFLN